METIECTECKTMIAIVERSKEFDATGEMNIVFTCPNKRCGCLVRLPLVSYGKCSTASER